MNTFIEKNGFRIEITPQFLSIQGVKFSPGEANKVISVLVWAARMSEMKALPPTVADGFFTVTFSEDGNHTLTRNDERSANKVTFTFSQVNTLVDLINNGVEGFKNNMEIQSLDRLKARGKVSIVGANFPDIIEGHN